MRRAIAVLALLAAVPSVAAEAATPERYVLPGDQVFPEGVALRPGTDQFFVTSTQDGTIFRGRLGRPRAQVFLRPGAQGRTSANGIKATRDRLIIAGSVLNRIDVVDLRTGDLVRRFDTGSGGLINDIALAPNGDAYATDSRRGLIFRIRAAQLRRRGAPVSLQPLVRVPEALAPSGYTNGIVVAGPRTLVVCVTSNGFLLRVDLRTRRVTQVTVDGGAVPAADGMALRGRTLYVVNAASRVTQLTLSPTAARARFVREITSPGFRLPTTVAIAGRRLLVVNSQFDRRSAGLPPVLPFTVSSVRRPT
jgi:DNA-binding beta-propeller fold protein YncE